jgi:hypothetical protein
MSTKRLKCDCDEWNKLMQWSFFVRHLMILRKSLKKKKKINDWVNIQLDCMRVAWS